MKNLKKNIKDILNNDITEHKYIRHETSLFNFIIFFPNPLGKGLLGGGGSNIVDIYST